MNVLHPSRSSVVLLALGALGGCQKKSPPPLPEPPAPTASAATLQPTAMPSAAPSPPPSAAPAAPPRPITEAQAALVWQAGGGSWKTVWVEPGASGVVVKRERQEPVVATRQALYALRVTRGATASVDAEPLGAGSSVELVQATVESCHEKDVEATVRIMGAMGSVVFTAGLGWVQSCDEPHPRWHDVGGGLDLDTRKVLSLDPFPGLGRLTIFARGKFLAAFGDDGGGCLLNPKETPELNAATFAYDGGGTLRGTYLFTMSSNYMCGNGPGHYTSPQELHDSSLPETVTFWKKTPAWLVPYLAKHPSIGVSPLPVELDAVAAALAFETAPLPPAKKP
jgi:hypothetical protein